jgi:hypothetical protein
MKHNIETSYKNHKGLTVTKKHSISDYLSAMEALHCIEKKTEQSNLINILESRKIISTAEAKKLKSVFTPQKAQVKQVKQRVADRKKESESKEFKSWMKKTISEMSDHPGFMSCAPQHQV